MMDAQSRRSLTTPAKSAKSAKLLAAEKRRKIAAKPSAKAKPVMPDGYLVARAKLTARLLLLRPQAKRELQKFRLCMTERFGKVPFGLYGVDGVNGRQLVVCVQCETSDKAIKRFAAAVRECEPAYNPDKSVSILVVLCTDAARHIQEIGDA